MPEWQSEVGALMAEDSQPEYHSVWHAIALGLGAAVGTYLAQALYNSLQEWRQQRRQEASR